MKKYVVCFNCKGLGYEDHVCVRADGETVTERVECECCGGLGEIEDEMCESTFDPFRDNGIPCTRREEPQNFEPPQKLNNPFDL